MISFCLPVRFPLFVMLHAVAASMLAVVLCLLSGFRDCARDDDGVRQMGVKAFCRWYS